MPINANSVISTQIQTYDNALYLSLTDKENYCYVTANAAIVAPSTNLSIYQPKFQALSDAVVAYITTNRNGIVTDLFSISVGYKMMNVMFNTDYAVAAQLPASSVFSINGMGNTIKNALIGVYSDYNGTVTTALDNDIALIANADNAESLNITGSIQPAMTAIVKAFSSRLLVEDIPAVGAISKQEVGQWFYGSGANDLGYSTLNTPLNFGLTIPAYVV